MLSNHVYSQFAIKPAKANTMNIQVNNVILSSYSGLSRFCKIVIISASTTPKNGNIKPFRKAANEPRTNYNLSGLIKAYSLFVYYFFFFFNFSSSFLTDFDNLKLLIIECLDSSIDLNIPSFCFEKDSLICIFKCCDLFD